MMEIVANNVVAGRLHRRPLMPINSSTGRRDIGSFPFSGHILEPDNLDEAEIILAFYL